MTITPYPLHVQPDGERIKYASHLVSYLPVEGRVRLRSAVSGSLILHSLLTSSQSSITKRRSSSAWAHLPQGCSLLPSGTVTRAEQTLQPGHQHLLTAALSGQLCQSWWVQGLERTRPSARWIPLLPGEASRAPVPFGTNCCATPWPLALPRGFLFGGGREEEGFSDLPRSLQLLWHKLRTPGRLLCSLRFPGSGPISIHHTRVLR